MFLKLQWVGADGSDMSLVLIVIALTVCFGSAVLMHALKHAPEGNEDGNGFEINAVNVRTYLQADASLQPAAVPIRSVNAA